MEHLHGNDHAGALRTKRINGEARGVAEDAHDHRGAPTELLQRGAEDEHREDLGDLADAHDGRDPVGGDADAAGFLRGAEEDAGPVEVAVVNEGIDERDEPEHEDEGVLEEAERFEPGERFLRAFRGAFRRRVREREAEGGERERGDAGDDEGPLGGGLRGITGERIREGFAEPVDETGGVRGIDGGPVDEDENEGPRGENPADGAAHAHDAEFLLGVPHVGERDRVRDGDGRHIEQAVDEHQEEERQELLGETATEDGETADEVGEREELLGVEFAVGPLVAEEHADDRGDGEGVQDQRLLAGREAEAGEVAEDER